MTPTLPTLAGTVEVADALSRLAIARGHAPDPKTAEVYLDDLAELDSRDVIAACVYLRRQPRAEYAPALPDVGTIRERAQLEAKLRAERVDAQATVRALPPGPDEPTYRCPECLDEPSGWRTLTCLGDGACGGRHCLQARRTHPYAARCRCWLQRHAERLRHARSQALEHNTSIPKACDELDDLEQGRYRRADRA